MTSAIDLIINQRNMFFACIGYDTPLLVVFVLKFLLFSIVADEWVHNAEPVFVDIRHVVCFDSRLCIP